MDALAQERDQQWLARQVLRRGDHIAHFGFHGHGADRRKQWHTRLPPGRGLLSSKSSMVRERVTIEALPDGVLLDVFEFYIFGWGFLPLPVGYYQRKKCQWYPLIHVCQGWRHLIFASTHRLDLCLYCTDRTRARVREKLEIWPPLPIKIWSESPNLGDNVIAALENHDRVREISLWRIRSPLDRLVTILQEPFPELESLSLEIYSATLPVLPDTFLGGSAPRLRLFHLDRIPFPTLPRLLLSCSGLVELSLSRIPRSGYIPSETMATSISTLTKLKYLFIGFDGLDSFDSPTSLPDWRTQHPPPLTRPNAVLPALTQFCFCGVSEYLEDLVTRINTPLLCRVNITLFDHTIFGTQQLNQFIGHAPVFMSYNRATIDFTSGSVLINCSSIEQFSGYLKFDIPCIGGDLQVSSMAQICSQFSFLISRIERLYIQARYLLDFRLEMDHTRWLELFHPFTAVKALYLPRQFWTLIMPAFNVLSEESVTDVLPSLVDLYLEGYQVSGSDIEPFITARQHSGHPVVAHRLYRL